MTAAVFSAVLFAAAAPARRALRIVDLLLGLAALAGVIVPITHGMGAYRWIGALPAAGAFAGVIAFCAFVWREHRRAASALLGAGIIGVVALVVVLRGELEGLVARGAGRGECYEAHRGPRAAAGFPLWERLADEKPSRIAVVGGFDGIGHEVFRYHFLGRSWQHRLVYVSPTVDGKLYDHPVLYPKDAKADAPELSFDRWRDRLREARVDYVVLVGPYNVMEHRWLVMHPELFHLEEVSAVDAARLYSVVAAPTETQMKP
jgi:hypothetical protein